MKRKLFTILISFCSIYLAKSQEAVYMSYFEVMNMHPDYEYSTSKLFKTYVEDNNKYRITLPPKPDSLTRPETFDQTMDNARKINAKYFITGDLNRLGEVVVISVAMYNTSDGSKVWSTTLKARTPDDIDPIMQKIANELGTTKKTAENDDIYNVTEYDARQLNKVNATTSLGLIIGGGCAIVSNVNKNLPAGFGFMATYDARNFIFDMKAEGYFSDVNVYSLNIDMLYPLTTKKSSPFIGGGLGWGGIDIKRPLDNQSIYYPYSNTNNTHGGGLIVMASGGYIFNRTGSVNLRFTVSPYFPLFKVGSDYPAGVLFNVAILFGGI